MHKIHRQTVYVAMSGGVDSSVAAALLKKRGFDVVGVFIKPWQPAGFTCLWKQDREDALRAASTLDIPLLTWNFSREYGNKVTRYMIEGYRRGITPNPDVMCNKEIKFGLFLKRALKEGADLIATGHYAKTESGKLLKAKDKNKDQTYFLWILSQNQLSRILFPIGEYTKSDVRKLAKKFSLPNWNKKDSQGVCFVGKLDVKDFLKSRIKPKCGKIYHVDGRVLGEHDGVYYYTIGQRHGFDVRDGGGPYFIVSKDIKKNIIVVGIEKDILARETQVVNMHWVSSEPPKFPARLMVKVRYRTPSVSATLHKNGRLVFTRPQRSITPGQSAVFYSGRTVLGGGVIM